MTTDTSRKALGTAVGALFGWIFGWAGASGLDWIYLRDIEVYADPLAQASSAAAACLLGSAFGLLVAWPRRFRSKEGLGVVAVVLLLVVTVQGIRDRIGGASGILALFVIYGIPAIALIRVLVALPDLFGRRRRSLWPVGVITALFTIILIATSVGWLGDLLFDALTGRRDSLRIVNEIVQSEGWKVDHVEIKRESSQMGWTNEAVIYLSSGDVIELDLDDR